MTEPADRPRGAGGRGGPPRPPGGPNRGGPPRGPGAPEPIRRVADADLRAIVVDGSAKATDDEARQIARGLAGQPPDGRTITGAQLRTLFGDLRRIEIAWPLSASPAAAESAARDLVLLKPKLAYLAGRAGSAARPLGDLQQILAPAIDLVGSDRRHFGHLIDFFEAILGYYFADARPLAGGR